MTTRETIDRYRDRADARAVPIGSGVRTDPHRFRGDALTDETRPALLTIAFVGVKMRAGA
jgi:hypothetical protein